MALYICLKPLTLTYGHRVQNTRYPVRSAIFKMHAGEIVLEWVTIWEYSLLYVFVFFPVWRVGQSALFLDATSLHNFKEFWHSRCIQ